MKDPNSIGSFCVKILSLLLPFSSKYFYFLINPKMPILKQVLISEMGGIKSFVMGIFGIGGSSKEEEPYFEENGWKIPTYQFLEKKRKEYTCPLTLKIPEKPTLAYCCKTYFEKDDIEKQIAQSNAICPKCKGSLPLYRLEKQENFEREDAIAMYEMELNRYHRSERGKRQEKQRSRNKPIEDKHEKLNTKGSMEEQIDGEIIVKAK